jgi:hypothetical protein
MSFIKPMLCFYGRNGLAFGRFPGYKVAIVRTADTAEQALSWNREMVKVPDCYL